MKFRFVCLALTATFVFAGAKAGHSQSAGIAERRAGLTGIVEKECRESGRWPAASICQCEARERIRQLSDADVMTLMRGSDAQRKQMHSKLSKHADSAIYKCLGDWGYGRCMKTESAAGTPPAKTKVYCDCVRKKYVANGGKFPDADRAFCEARIAN